MTRHILVTFLFLFAALATSAQSRISVKEETFDDMETTAMVNPEKDRNNRDCALVIFHNVEPDGYYFDAGSVFIKAENHISRDNGEKTVFLYISEGAKLINIRHKNDGIMSLRYEFANGPLQARHTYHVFLGKVVPANANAKQYLRFKVTPATAMLEVEEQPGVFVPWIVDPTTGKASKILPLGDYTYRVSARQYHSTAGAVSMTDASKAFDETVTLKPAYGTLSIAPIAGATVFIDNETVADYGAVNLDPGQHAVKILRPKYKLFHTTVNIAEGETTRLTPDFEANFGTVRLLASAPDVTISLREASNDRTLGTGSWSGDLDAGTYTVVCSAPGHRETVHTISVPAGAQNLAFNLPAPSPLYGSINVSSTPDGATIKLDGQTVGETPLLLNNVLVGKHTVLLELAGKGTYSASVDVPENGSCDINAEMKDASSAKGAYVHNNSGKLFPVTDNLDELPDFIFHPLGYNGEWDLRGSAEKTKKQLNNYFKSLGKMKKEYGFLRFKSPENFTQQIGDINVQFDGSSDIIYAIVYSSQDSTQFDDIIRYFSPIIIGEPVQKGTVTEFYCREIADGFIDISLSCSRNRFSIFIHYRTRKETYYYNK